MKTTACARGGDVSIIARRSRLTPTATPFALVFDFKGFRTRQVQRDKRVNRWLYERHLWFNDQREYHSRYFIQAGIATFMGLVVIAGSVQGLITC